MGSVDFVEVTKEYGESAERPAVDDLNISIEDGEFVVFVGPSGCGKSTALRMIAGLEEITSGELRISGDVVNQKSPKDRDIAMVFQNYALYPHMSVYKNLEYPLKIAKVPKADRKNQVEATARTLQLTEFLNRKPGNLSGGQRQRVAMGRALIRRPAVFLMDEPLSNLDAKLRVAMRSEISRIHDQLKVTTVYVTHDQVEAMTMGDRVAVLNRGQLQQIDSPETLYRSPENMFVASFIGSPAMNLFNSTFTMIDDSTGQITLGEQTLRVSNQLINDFGLKAYNKRSVVVGIRPDDITDAEDSANPVDPAECIDITVQLREALGSEVICHFDCGAERLVIDEQEDSDDLPDNRQAFVGRFAPLSKARIGEKRRAHFDVKQLHFFDPSTELRLGG